jgi:hypothetical protein
VSFATRLSSVLMPCQAARTKEARDAIANLKRSASERAQEQDLVAGIAAAGTAGDLRVTLHALSRKLAS